MEASEEDGKIVPARKVACYARVGPKYEEVAAERCGLTRKPAAPKKVRVRGK